MDTKLTLKLDKDIIEKAKEYAAKQKISLSRFVENYLNAVTSMEKPIKLEKNNFSELANKIAIDGIILPEDFNYKKEIQDILFEKYNSL